MLERLLDRAKTSHRTDDNRETFIKRMRTYRNDTQPVLDYYESKSKLVKIDSNKTIEEVYRQVKTAIEKVVNK